MIRKLAVYLFIVVWAFACAHRPHVFRNVSSIEEIAPLNHYEKIELDNFDKRLNLLLSVQDEIPSILEDAAKFGVNLFEILERQEEIQNELLSDGEYREMMDQYHSKQIEIKISPKKNQKIYTYEIDSGQLDRFRWNLKEALTEYKDMKGVKRELFHKINALGMKSSRGLETGLIKSLPKNLQKNAFELKDKKELSSYLAKHLPKKLPADFKAGDYALIDGAKATDALKKLTQLRLLEEKASLLMALTLLNSEAVGDFNADVLRIQKEALAQFSNKEVLGLRIDQLKSGELKNLSGKINDNVYQLTLNFFREYSSKIQSEEEWIDEGITLRQISPSLAIFRGYVGCDCATKRSFAYINIPTEIVYFIYDKNSKAKGYVEGHIVENENGQKVFKIISFNGPKLSSQDIILTLEGLNANKNELKVAYIALPALDRIDTLINYDVIKATLKESIAKSKIEEITYLDAKYRTYLSELGGKYNESVYDAMELNTNAVRYQSENIALTTERKWYSTQYRLNKIKSKRHLDFIFKSNVIFSDFEKNIDDVSYVKYEYDDIIKERKFYELFEKFKYYLNLKDEDLYLSVRNYFSYFKKTTDFYDRLSEMPIEFFEALSDEQIKQTFNGFQVPPKKMMKLLIQEGSEEMRRYAFGYLGAKTDYFLDDILEKVIGKLSADDFNIMLSTMKNKMSDKFYQKHMELFFDKGDSGTHRHLITKLEVIQDKKLIKKLLKTVDNSYVNSILFNNLSLSKDHVDNEIFELLLARNDKGVNQRIIDQIFSKEWSKSYNKYFKIIVNNPNNAITLTQLTKAPLFMNQKDVEKIILNKLKEEELKDKSRQGVKNAIRSLVLDENTGKNYRLLHMIFDEFQMDAFETFIASRIFEREVDYNQQFAKEILSKIKRSKDKSAYYKLLHSKIFNTYSNISFSFLYEYVMSLNQVEQMAFLEDFVTTRNAFKADKQMLLIHDLVQRNRTYLIKNKRLSDRINAYVEKHQENNSLEAKSIKSWLSTPPKIQAIVKNNELNCVEMIRLFYK